MEDLVLDATVLSSNHVLRTFIAGFPPLLSPFLHAIPRLIKATRATKIVGLPVYTTENLFLFHNFFTVRKINQTVTLNQCTYRTGMFGVLAMHSFLKFFIFDILNSFPGYKSH